MLALMHPPGGGSIHPGSRSGHSGTVCLPGGEPADTERHDLHNWTRYLQDSFLL